MPVVSRTRRWWLPGSGLAVAAAVAIAVMIASASHGSARPPRYADYLNGANDTSPCTDFPPASDGWTCYGLPTPHP
jgi:hypothetical protein